MYNRGRRAGGGRLSGGGGRLGGGRPGHYCIVVRVLFKCIYFDLHMFTSSCSLSLCGRPGYMMILCYSILYYSSYYH